MDQNPLVTDAIRDQPEIPGPGRQAFSRQEFWRCWRRRGIHLSPAGHRRSELAMDHSRSSIEHKMHHPDRSQEWSAGLVRPLRLGDAGVERSRADACSLVAPKIEVHEIAPQSLRIAVRVGQCDVAVRPDKIQSPAHETGASHLRASRRTRGSAAGVRRRRPPRRGAARRKHELARPAKSAGRNYPGSARFRPRAGDRRPGRSRPHPRSAGSCDTGCRSVTRSGRGR